MKGPMICVRVLGVHKKQLGSYIPIYEIVGENWKLDCTELHSFLTIRNNKEMYLQPTNLKENDLIWVDRHAHLCDGSLTKMLPGEK